MAHLIRPTKTVYTLGGRQVPKGTAGARKVRKKAAKWYGQGVPGYPPKKRFPLATDKQVAKRMLADLVSGAERGQARLPDRAADRKPLADHLAAFREAAALGLASRSRSSKRRPSAKQVGTAAQRVRDALAGCGFRSVADLNDPKAPGKLAAYLQGRTALPRKAGGLSEQSAAFVLAAVRRFVWWLSARAAAPVRADLFDDVPGFDPKNNRVHARRDVTPDELARVLEAAREGPAVRGLAGEDRYFVYLVAFATGFRAGELAELRPEFFDLDAPTPLVILPAKFTKNKKPARQPIPPGVAYQLRTYLARKPTGRPVWPGPTWNEKPALMLRHDLEAAGVPYRVETPDGPRFADFHALRHSFLSSLANAGVGVKELQELARHSDPRVTIGVYTHARPEALGASVARLPLPGAGDDNPLARMTRAELESIAAGLAGLVAGLAAALLSPAAADAPRVAPSLAAGGDGTGRAGTEPAARRSA